MRAKLLKLCRKYSVDLFYLGTLYTVENTSLASVLCPNLMIDVIVGEPECFLGFR